MDLVTLADVRALQQAQASPRPFSGFGLAIDGRVDLRLIDGRLAFCSAEFGFYFMPACYLVVSSLRGNR